MPESFWLAMSVIATLIIKEVRDWQRLRNVALAVDEVKTDLVAQIAAAAIDNEVKAARVEVVAAKLEVERLRVELEKANDKKTAPPAPSR